MLPALALLWSLADRPRDAAFWGLFAVLISHRWILGLHPLTWMGLPAWLSLPVAVSLLLVCCVAASLLLLLWSLLARWCRSRDGSWRFGQVLLLAMVWGSGTAAGGSPSVLDRCRRECVASGPLTGWPGPLAGQRRAGHASADLGLGALAALAPSGETQHRAGCCPCCWPMPWGRSVSVRRPPSQPCALVPGSRRFPP